MASPNVKKKINEYQREPPFHGVNRQQRQLLVTEPTDLFVEANNKTCKFHAGFINKEAKR